MQKSNLGNKFTWCAMGQEDGHYQSELSGIVEINYETKCFGKHRQNI